MWAVAAGVAVCVVGVLIAVWGDDGDGVRAAGPDATTERSTTTAPPTAASTTVPATTAAGAPTTAAPTTAPGVIPPGPVTVVSAATGGGSGEVVVDWNAVVGATGYRVLRSGAAEGPYGVAADVDVITGGVTADPDVATIWSDQRSYLHPGVPPPASPDTSPWFQLVNLGDGQRCFQVVAYNAGGDAPPSPVVCGWPP